MTSTDQGSRRATAVLVIGSLLRLTRDAAYFLLLMLLLLAEVAWLIHGTLRNPWTGAFLIALAAWLVLSAIAPRRPDRRSKRVVRPARRDIPSPSDHN